MTARPASEKRPRGRPPSDDRDADASRRELLDAAASVFAERGFSGASVEEIIRRAGLSKGTYYWNFESKEDIFLALVDERIDTPARGAVAAITEAPTDARPSADLSQALAVLFRRERDVVLLLHEFTLLAARNPAVAARHRQRQRARRRFLAQTLAARHEQTGVPLTMPAEDLAEAFLALADGLALRSITEPRAPRATLFGDIASLVYDGIASRTA